MVLQRGAQAGDALVHALELVGPLLAPEGVVVAKHFWRDAPPAQPGLLASVRVRRFGETALTFYRRPTAAPAERDERREREEAGES